MESFTNTPDRDKPQLSLRPLDGGAADDRRRNSDCDALRSSEEKELVAIAKNRSPHPSDVTARLSSQETRRLDVVERGSFDTDKKRARKSGAAAGKDVGPKKQVDLAPSHKSLPSLCDL